MFSFVPLLAMAMAYLANAESECSSSSCMLTTERLAKFEAKDYIFDLKGAAMESESGSASFNAGTSSALFDTFISGVVIDFKKCGINLPHIHPRATEIAMVLKG